MAYRMYSDEKIKILLLYLMKELDQDLDFQTISEIIVWDGSINYFVFTDCFNKLVENGSIEKVSDESGNEVYHISHLGRISVESVEDTVLNPIKGRIMRSATRLLAFKKDGSTVSSRVEKSGDGYNLISTVRNNKFDLMEVKLYLDNKEEADMMKDGFDKRAEHIYRTVLALFSGDLKFLS